MKIYFSAAHSLGKTTLTKYVSDTYKLPMISEVARMVQSEKELNFDSLRSNINVVNDYQKSIFYRQIEEESKHESFVCDRSLIDSLAYSSQYTNIFSSLIRSEELKNYLVDLKKSNAILFFIRPSRATLKDDGVRESLNWDNIITIDANIKLLYEMFDLRYFQINTDNMQERIKLVESVISLVK